MVELLNGFLIDFVLICMPQILNKQDTFNKKRYKNIKRSDSIIYSVLILLI